MLRRRNHPLVLPAFAAFLMATATLGCRPEPLPGEPNSDSVLGTGADQVADEEEGEDPVLLQIANYAFTIGDFERRAARLSDEAQLKLNTTQTRNGLLEMFVWVELLAYDAAQQGLVGLSDEVFFVDEAVARARLEYLASANVNQDTLAEGLPEYYEERREELLTRPERRRIYGIVVDDRALAESVRGELEQALEHVRPVHAFQRLADLYSTHRASAEDKGRMGWLVRVEEGGTGDPALTEAVFAMEDYGLGPIVETSRGYEIFYVSAIIDGMELELDDARRYLTQLQYDEATADFQRAALDGEREDADAQIDASAVARLAAARAEVDPQAPESPVRPRRFSREALAGEPVAEIGIDVVAEVMEETARIVANPRTVPRDPPFAHADGSGEGSGDAEGL